MLPFKKILCPTDFSQPSYKGVEMAVELAGHFSAELLLINVITPVYPGGAPGIPAHYKEAEYYRAMEQSARSSMKEIRNNRVPATIKARSFVVTGDAVESIVAQAETENVDLVVMATHGWTGWRKLFLGSVTDKVLRSVSCPVLTVSETGSELE